MCGFLQHNGVVVRVNGYASLFDTEIRIDGQIESIAPGAFSPTCNRGAIDVRMTVNHHCAATWASVRDGSLKVWQDAVGLAFSAAFPDTSHGRGLARAVADGLIVASVLFRSFGQKPTPGGYIVTAATLTDVCLTTAAAYPTATWLSDFGLMRHMSDHALLLRRQWIGGQLKAKREAGDHVTQSRVVPSPPARGAPSRAELAATAYQEAQARRRARRAA